MRLGKRIDIIDKAFGDIIFTSTSKYGGVSTVENAARYCRRHGYKIVEFKDGAAYVIPAEYSTVEEYERVETEKYRKASLLKNLLTIGEKHLTSIR